MVSVVDRVTFSLRRGETFGLVGESGSGKSVTALAILGLLARNARVAEGTIRLHGQELRGMRESALRRIRGNQIGMIFQEPRRSLDPAFTVGDQIAETVRAHNSVSRSAAWSRAVEMLDLVGIPSAEKRARNYPHQFSGGMAQRVMLAVALSCSPELLIADEPTTALDVTVQSQVLGLIRGLQQDMGLAVIFISHDLGVIAGMCDRVAVMYAGQIVEHRETEALYLRPKHPYTSALLQSIPSLTSTESSTLVSIPGRVPPAHAWPSGCRFHPRALTRLNDAQQRFPCLQTAARDVFEWTSWLLRGSLTDECPVAGVAWPREVVRLWSYALGTRTTCSRGGRRGGSRG